ncbi:recombinase family protein [Lysobacter antibioticus]|uniref:recombinase family protein n=1 Tax=Lysobacter antibioticus TaxID=84531 RepID=UPI00071647B3|nr:recombinase family protein [Lysobacter antibioticus]
MSGEEKIGNVVIYARSDVPDPGAILQQYAQAQRAAEEVFGESATVTYCDDGMAGSTVRRPGLQSMLRHMDAGFVRAIVVASDDRLTRSYMDDLRLRVRFEIAGVPLIVAKGQAAEASEADRCLAVERPRHEGPQTGPPAPWLARALSVLRIKRY